ncbi:hypothetical protein JB92DRAFT_2842134 [Gautieria morchelliformis]|nr:hypothetical protein JB92DRAFT_2842134 [Gautieria morchelliformis]
MCHGPLLFETSQLSRTSSLDSLMPNSLEPRDGLLGEASIAWEGLVQYAMDFKASAETCVHDTASPWNLTRSGCRHCGYSTPYGFAETEPIVGRAHSKSPLPTPPSTCSMAFEHVIDSKSPCRSPSPDVDSRLSVEPRKATFKRSHSSMVTPNECPGKGIAVNAPRPRKRRAAVLETNEAPASSAEISEPEPSRRSYRTSKKDSRRDYESDEEYSDLGGRSRASKISTNRYECQQCGCSCSRSSDLTRHIDTVHRSRQWQCSGCSQIFSRKDAVKRHIKRKKCRRKSEV